MNYYQIHKQNLKNEEQYFGYCDAFPDDKTAIRWLAQTADSYDYIKLIRHTKKYTYKIYITIESFAWTGNLKYNTTIIKEET